MASPTTRRLVLEEFKRRLELIVAVAVFETSAGSSVWLGQLPELGPDDPATAIAIVPAETDPPGWRGVQALVKLPIEVHALARADLAEPWIAVEQMIGDIKRAIEIDHGDMGGLITPNSLERLQERPYPPAAGSLVVGAVVPYQVSIVEVWGDPT